MIKSVGMSPVSFSSTNLLEQYKEKLKNVTPAEPPKTDGGQALANYNKAMINQSPAILKDLKPSEIVTIQGNEADTLQGEKIYTSNGTLEAIVQKGEKVTKEYHFSYDKNLNEIIEKNNETSKVLKRVTFGKIENKLTCASITEYGPNAGDEKYTAFADGKLSFVQETKNGVQRGIGFYPDGNVRTTAETDNANGMEKVTKYKDGKIESVKYYKDDEIKMNSVYSPDGNGIAQYTNEKFVVPDFDLEKTKEKMQPDDINSIKLPENIETLQGEKKFRSNGTLESLEVKGANNTSTEYIMDFDGKKVKTVFEKENDITVKSYGFNDDGSLFMISNWLGNEKSTYFKNGKPEEVKIIENGIHKHIEFSQDGKTVRYYCEWNPETQKSERSIIFDKNEEPKCFVKNSPEGNLTLVRGITVEPSIFI